MVYPNRRKHATAQSGRNFAFSATLSRRMNATVHWYALVHFVCTGSFGTDATFHLQRFISQQTCSASTKGTASYRNSTARPCTRREMSARIVSRWSKGSTNPRPSKQHSSRRNTCCPCRRGTKGLCASWSLLQRSTRLHKLIMPESLQTGHNSTAENKSTTSRR